jgi:uncharacterized membrane protein
VDRINAIKESLATFVCGVLSCVPLVGLIPAVYALANWRHVSLNFREDWNPASHYLAWGAILALLNILLTILGGGAIAALFIARHLS